MKPSIAMALAVGLYSLAGTGHAAPRIAIQADVADDDTTIAAGRYEGIAGADRGARRKLEALMADANRNAALRAMSKDWRGPRLAAFARLLAAEQVFARALATNETGAMPGSKEASDTEQAEKDVFVATMQQLVAGKLARGETTTEDTDDALNDVYGRVMKVGDTSELGWGGVEKAGILRTQRAWIAYRDAFAAFAAKLDVPDAVETIAWELTRQRTASLDTFLGD